MRQLEDYAQRMLEAHGGDWASAFNEYMNAKDDLRIGDARAIAAHHSDEAVERALTLAWSLRVLRSRAGLAKG